MKNSGAIVFSHAEIKALYDYSRVGSQARTFRVQRDTKNVFHVIEPSGRLTRMTPAP